MTKLAKLARGLNCRDALQLNSQLPKFFVMSDPQRLPDPLRVLDRVPRGAAIVLRHRDANALQALARHVMPHARARARARGLKVIISGDIRLALALGADGVHLSEHQARIRGQRFKHMKPGFLVTAAAHSRMALWRAARAGAQAAFLSPVFATKSHPYAKPLGPIRFARIANASPLPVIALGGIHARHVKRLRLGPAVAIAAIEAWDETEP